MRKAFFKRNNFKLLILFFFIMVLFLVLLVGYGICFGEKSSKIGEKVDALDDMISISYVGDLILLKDQVSFSYDRVSKKYDFKYMFERTKKYFNESDYTIGVFEGPVSNEKMGYSTSNYGDGIKIYLGFPEAFADAVRDSGIDFVSTANNHLMDRGKEGVFNTIDYLDKIGLDHTGSYKNAFDKNKVKIINVKGVKIAVLAYTMGSNYYKSDYFVSQEPNLTSVIVSKNDKNFDKIKNMVKRDFDNAKNSGADLVMVMPHMGSQFVHETNQFQDMWNDIFISYGADIILGDHAHATQPVEFRGDTLIVNCPGNFANSYVKDDGDATSIVEFYIDKDAKKVDSASVVPMYTKLVSKGRYQAVPVYDIYADESLYNSFSRNEISRVSEVQKVVTKSTIGKEVSVNQLQKRYFVYNDGSDEEFDFDYALSESILKKYLDSASEVAFIGDSITHGTRNGFHGWYEPFMKLYPDVKVVNISRGSYTTKKIISNFSDRIKRSDADIYFVALGTNDIRYRDRKMCSMTSDEYISNIDRIIKLIGNSDVKIVLIAPWISLVNDSVAKIGFYEKNRLIEDYSFALSSYADDKGYIYVDANRYISSYLQRHNVFDYLVDYIHPNSGKGIDLYSYAVLEASKRDY